MGRANVVDIHLHPHLPLEHGWGGGGAPLILQAEGHRTRHAVLEVSDLKNGIENLKSHCISFRFILSFVIPVGLS